MPLFKIDFESFKCPFCVLLQHIGYQKAEIPLHGDNVMNICFLVIVLDLELVFKVRQNFFERVYLQILILLFHVKGKEQNKKQKQRKKKHSPYTRKTTTTTKFVHGRVMDFAS